MLLHFWRGCCGRPSCLKKTELPRHLPHKRGIQSREEGGDFLTRSLHTWLAMKPHAPVIRMFFFSVVDMVSNAVGNLPTASHSVGFLRLKNVS